jgi:hypothetical protein
MSQIKFLKNEEFTSFSTVTLTISSVSANTETTLTASPESGDL